MGHQFGEFDLGFEFSQVSSHARILEQEKQQKAIKHFKRVPRIPEQTKGALHSETPPPSQSKNKWHGS